jgi:hypothetical protein
MPGGVIHRSADLRFIAGLQNLFGDNARVVV